MGGMGKVVFAVLACIAAAAFAVFRMRSGSNGERPVGALADMTYSDASKAPWMKDRWLSYYEDAERHMRKQWKKHIWPNIKNAEFRSIVEIAAGHGRNTELLINKALELSPPGKVVATDINQEAIAFMKKRFAEHRAVRAGTLQFYLNNGSSLPMVPDSSATFVYSWDAMVHFPAWAVAQYLKEISRMLQPGGMSFLHHANMPRCPPGVSPHFAPKACGRENNFKNPGARSLVNASFVADNARQSGLEVVRQAVFGWGKHHSGAHKGLPLHYDCMSVLRKPHSHPA